MAYDVSRGTTILFGGYAGTFPGSNETWEWSGSAWTLRTATGPAPRSGLAMTYDSTRDVIHLFGGYVGPPSFYSGETWDWNGTAWSRSDLIGPSPRFYPTMTHDAARGVTVLFGGIVGGSTYNGETWELGASCSLPTNPTPPVVEPPVQTACGGGSVNFTVHASAGGPLTYQWRKDGTSLADTPNHIAGASAMTLTILNAIASDGGTYDCVVSHAQGSAVSTAATLSTCAADFNCDGILASQDFFDFLAAFFSGC
jgi:hypothetical protein